MRINLYAWLLPCMLMLVPSAQADSLEELQALKKQMRLMQEKIDAIETKLKASEASKDAAMTGVEPVPSRPVQVDAAPEGAAEAVASADVSNVPLNAAANANAFNPQISFVLNGGYRAFARDPALFAVPGFAPGDAAGIGDRGLGINESELNLAANVDNRFYASTTLSLAPGGGLTVEEAYARTLDLPAGMTLKGGRFFSGIGYINEFHPHHDDFIDRSLANRVFLNTTFAGDGLQMRWLAPTDTYLELGGELLRGDRWPGGGAGLRGSGSWDAFVRAGGDVGFSNSWLAGLSWLGTKPVGRQSFDNAGAVTGTFDGTSHLMIADLVWKWAPNGNPVDRNFKFQAELFAGREAGIFTGAATPSGSLNSNRRGGYAEAVYQFTHGWNVGLRYSGVYAGNNGSAVAPGGLLDSAGYHPWRTSLVLGYANSEFSRFRLQLSRDRSQTRADSQLALQYIMLIGAHGAHQF